MNGSLVEKAPWPVTVGPRIWPDSTSRVNSAAITYTVPVNDKAQDVKCPTCEALPGKPCCRENGSVLADSHLARKALASVEVAKAKKKAAQVRLLHEE